MTFDEDFELRLEFESIEDRFSSGFLNLSDLLKINKFTASDFSSFGKTTAIEKPGELKDLYSIGDEEDEEFLKTDNSDKKIDDEDSGSVENIEGFEISKELEEDLEEDLEDHLSNEDDVEDDDDDFDHEDLDNEEYFRKLEEET